MPQVFCSLADSWSILIIYFLLTLEMSLRLLYQSYRREMKSWRMKSDTSIIRNLIVWSNVSGQKRIENLLRNILNQVVSKVKFLFILFISNRTNMKLAAWFTSDLSVMWPTSYRQNNKLRPLKFFLLLQCVF